MTQEHKRRRRRRRRSSGPIVTRTEEKVKLPHKHIIVVFALFMVAIGLYNALNFTLANLEYNEAKAILNNWTLDETENKHEEYKLAEIAINNALSYHFDKPLYIETYAQIIEWGVIFGVVDSGKLEKAERLYLSALKKRPLWPVTYANLAMIKWRLGQFDDEFRQYLLTADQLGPQTQETHLLFTQLGIALYQANHPLYTELKDLIFKRIRAGLRNSHTRPKVLAYLANTDSKADVCRWFKEFDRYTAVRHLDCSY